MRVHSTAESTTQTRARSPRAAADASASVSPSSPLPAPSFAFPRLFCTDHKATLHAQRPAPLDASSNQERANHATKSKQIEKWKTGPSGKVRLCLTKLNDVEFCRRSLRLVVLSLPVASAWLMHALKEGTSGASSPAVGAPRACAAPHSSIESRIVQARNAKLEKQMLTFEPQKQSGDLLKALGHHNTRPYPAPSGCTPRSDHPRVLRCKIANSKTLLLPAHNVI